MILFKITTSIFLMVLLTGCEPMACEPPPPSIQFALFTEQGVNVSKRYTSIISAYLVDGPTKRTEAVTAIPRDTSVASPIAFESYFPSLGTGLERTFYLDIKDGNSYPVVITYSNEKSPCGRIIVMRDVYWNGKLAEKISAEPRYKFVIRGN